MLRRFLTSLAIVAFATLAACESTGSTTQPASTQASMGMVNDTCPISGAPVDASASTVSMGAYEVGFCCDSCPAAWDKKSPEERRAFIDDSVASVSPGALCDCGHYKGGEMCCVEGQTMCGCGKVKGSPGCCK